VLWLGDCEGAGVAAGVDLGVLGTQPHLSPLVKACNILQLFVGTHPSLDLCSSKPHVKVPFVGMLTSKSGDPTIIPGPHGLQYGWSSGHCNVGLFVGSWAVEKPRNANNRIAVSEGIMRVMGIIVVAVEYVLVPRTCNILNESSGVNGGIFFENEKRD
jgi:hypothetical protein